MQKNNEEKPKQEIIISSNFLFTYKNLLCHGCPDDKGEGVEMEQMLDCNDCIISRFTSSYSCWYTAQIIYYPECDQFINKLREYFNVTIYYNGPDIFAYGNKSAQDIILGRFISDRSYSWGKKLGSCSYISSSSDCNKYSLLNEILYDRKEYLYLNETAKLLQSKNPIYIDFNCSSFSVNEYNSENKNMPDIVTTNEKELRVYQKLIVDYKKKKSNLLDICKNLISFLNSESIINKLKNLIH